ncbi:MAG: 50S ribosome-binding GTPase [Methylococcales bacterium]|nr:50S ribosome-binding GTPase [Methylococcales bacterium]
MLIQLDTKEEEYILDLQQQFEEKFEQAFVAFKRSVKKPNILLIGSTGVGKSSLINTCFGEDLAKVGVGQPVTKHIESFSCDSKSVVLFDTQGYEIGSGKEQKFLNEVVEYATDFRESDNPIHIAWYCIQAGGARIVDFDISIIQKIQQAGLPIAIVLTKADLLNEEDARKLRQTIKEWLPQIEVFETTIEDKLNNLQLAELCQWSVDNLPTGLQISFVAAQRKNINLKRAEANKIILQHIAGAGLVGFAPIPFANAPLLVSNQAGMIARILFIYDMGSYASQVKDLAGVGLVSLMAQSSMWVVAELLKMFPAVGTVAGGMITGAVAATMVYAIGTTVSEFCATFSEKALSGNTTELKAFIDGKDTFFADEVTKNFKRKQG